jgi:hypothetical protein
MIELLGSSEELKQEYGRMCKEYAIQTIYPQYIPNAP